jgi:GT2 family glycosyltransferase
MRRCSVIIVTYNSAAQIEACVRALAAQDCEIIVVDNASQDDTVSRVRNLAGEIPRQLVVQPRNSGFAGGVNQGVRAASGEVLLILNPDAIAEAGAIDALLTCLNNSGAVAVGCALFDAHGAPAAGFAFRRLPKLSSLLFEAMLLNQLWSGNPVNRKYRCLDADLAREQFVEQPAGACLAVTRAAWVAVGGMDTQFYPVWFEDVDLCTRLLQIGGPIVYCPAAHFRHSGAHSVGKLSFQDKQRFWYTNMLRYAQKHFSRGKVTMLRVGIVAGMALRSLATLLGGKPPAVSTSTAVKSYWSVAKMATSSPARDQV